MKKSRWKWYLLSANTVASLIIANEPFGFNPIAFLDQLTFGGLGAFVVGAIIDLVIDKVRLSKVPKTPATKACPYCAESIKYQALICRYCQKELPVIEPGEILHSQKTTESNAGSVLVAFILIASSLFLFLQNSSNFVDGFMSQMFTATPTRHYQLIPTKAEPTPINVELEILREDNLAAQIEEAYNQGRILTLEGALSICPNGCFTHLKTCDIKGKNIYRQDPRFLTKFIYIYYESSHTSYDQIIVDPFTGDRWFCSTDHAESVGAVPAN